MIYVTIRYVETGLNYYAPTWDKHYTGISTLLWGDNVTRMLLSADAPNLHKLPERLLNL